MYTEYPEKYITMGLKIAYFRKKAGYTQESFAEKIGKSVNFLAQVEGTGTIRGISLETLFKIADVLRIPPAKLLLPPSHKALYPRPQTGPSFPAVCAVLRPPPT